MQFFPLFFQGNREKNSDIDNNEVINCQERHQEYELVVLTDDEQDVQSNGDDNMLTDNDDIEQEGELIDRKSVV